MRCGDGRRLAGSPRPEPPRLKPGCAVTVLSKLNRPHYSKVGAAGARLVAIYESWSNPQMKKFLAVIALAFFAAPGAAQDAPKPPTAKVAGNWDFSFTSPQGSATWRINFDQAGDTLRGQAATGDFGNVDVSDGWVSGEDITFTLNINFSGQAIALNFAGKVKGDTVQGTIDVPVATINFPFTAVKAAGTQGSTGLLATSFPVERPKLVRHAVR